MTTRLLLVGDPHAEASDLDDVGKLLDYVHDLALKHRGMIVLLGDQYHTHAIIHVRVMAAWRRFASRCHRDGLSLTMMRGNHDQPGPDVSDSEVHSLIAHEGQCTVVAEPYVENGVGYLPYYHDREAFVAACNSPQLSHLKTLICHQTFDGSTYENGFPASDGVDPNLLPQQVVISGHIHTPQSFGKVWYPGAPRWRTAADANVDRAVWLVDFDGGVPVRKQAFPTGDVCRRIVRLEDRPGAEVDPTDLDPKHDNRVDVFGPVDRVEERKKVFAGRAKVRTFPDAAEKPLLSEAEGVGRAFEKWLGGFTAKRGTPREVVGEMLREAGLGR